MKREEMKNIAPKLAALKNNSGGFLAPNDALENTEFGVLAQLKELHLKEKNGNENPFKVSSQYFKNFEESFEVLFSEKQINYNPSSLLIPDQYFNSVEHNVLSKLKSIPKEKEVNVISLRSRFIKFSITAVAASIALVFIFNPFQQTNELSFDSLNLTEIEKWIENDHLELNAYQIAAVYNDVELQPNLLNTMINEEEMENFISNERIDILLYEE